MLSVPTLWTVFVINFLALGLIWAYVAHSYPAFGAARLWTASAFVASAGAACAMLRVMLTDSLLPLLAAGTLMVFAAGLAAMGIKRFYGKGRDRAAKEMKKLLSYSMNQVDSPSVYRTKVPTNQEATGFTTIGADVPEERTPPEVREVGAAEPQQAGE